MDLSRSLVAAVLLIIAMFLATFVYAIIASVLGLDARAQIGFSLSGLLFAFIVVLFYDWLRKKSPVPAA